MCQHSSSVFILLVRRPPLLLDIKWRHVLPVLFLNFLRFNVIILLKNKTEDSDESRKIWRVMIFGTRGLMADSDIDSAPADVSLFLGFRDSVDVSQ